ncbi:MAG: hypothetical protein AAFO94_10980, partial [Bacteroidota bacterium]
MRIATYCLLLLFGLGLTFVLLELRHEKKEEKLIAHYCGGCHLTPQAEVLTKNIWQQHVLPQMSLYYKWDQYSEAYPYANMAIYKKKGQLPMNDAVWQRIEQYYLSHSPESIPIRAAIPYAEQQQFREVEITNLCELPAVTAIEVAPEGGLLAACNNQLIRFDLDGQQQTLYLGREVITDLQVLNEDTLLLLNAGELNPHNQARGSLLALDVNSGRTTEWLAPLHRPVRMHLAEDKLHISEYGHEVGQFTQYNLTSGAKDTLA